MGKKFNDLPTYAGVLAVTDYVCVARMGQPAGSRDFKFASNAIVTLADVQIITNKTLASPVVTGNMPVGGIITPTGGIAAAGGFAVPTVFHSGGMAPNTTTTGTDTTPVVTETYICEVFVPHNCTLTGVSVLNGSAVAGNMQISLADSAGNPIAAAQTASTAASGTAAYQKVPFVTPYAAKGPAKYFILLQNNNVANRYRSHILGNFGASKKTAEVYGTFTVVTPPTTFTTGLGPIADLY